MKFCFLQSKLQTPVLKPITYVKDTSARLQWQKQKFSSNFHVVLREQELDSNPDLIVKELDVPNANVSRSIIVEGDKNYVC